MTYHVSFTTSDPVAVERLRAMNGTRIDALTVTESHGAARETTELAPGSSQTDRLLHLLRDGYPHRTDEIMQKVYGSEHLGIARIGARIADLKKKGYTIPDATPDPNKPTLYWYRIESLVTT